MRIPPGGIPKNEPRAGATLYTMVASLSLDAPVKPDAAITGELTLRAAVIPFTGLEKKLLAAHRATTLARRGS